MLKIPSGVSIMHQIAMSGDAPDALRMASALRTASALSTFGSSTPWAGMAATAAMSA